MHCLLIKMKHFWLKCSKDKWRIILGTLILEKQNDKIACEWWLCWNSQKKKKIFSCEIANSLKLLRLYHSKNNPIFPKVQLLIVQLKNSHMTTQRAANLNHLPHICFFLKRKHSPKIKRIILITSFCVFWKTLLLSCIDTYGQRHTFWKPLKNRERENEISLFFLFHF